MTEPPLTWEDVQWLRMEAARRERAAKTTRDPQSAAELQSSAERARRIARTIGERLQRGEAA